MRRYALAILANGLAAGLAAPAAAIPADASILRANLWVPAKETPPKDTACNYIYTDGTDILYYGTSGSCLTRLNSHFAVSRSGYEMLKAVVALTPADKQAALLVSMAQWVRQVDDGGNTMNNGSSDNCLGALQTQKTLEIWYLPLITRKQAEEVEKEVLKSSKGYCNRQGAGNTKGSTGSFQAAVSAAMK